MYRIGLIVILSLLFGGTAVLAGEPPPAPPQEGDSVAGTWVLFTSLRGREMESRLEIKREADGSLTGTYHNSGGRGSSPAVGISFAEGKLKFQRAMRAQSVGFEAALEGNRLTGLHRLGAQEIPVVGARGKKAVAALRKERKKANERGSDLEADYERHSMRAAARDAFPVLFDPKLTPAAEDDSILADEFVIGVVVGDEAKAYPIAIMGKHELANDTCGGIPIAASW